jgi:DNA-directed RNA polymerase subunit H (RpoH/RPB5)
LSKANEEKVKARYNISDNSQVPGISRFSPVAQAIGLRPGEMCKIIRPSRTAITSEFYRICSP